MKIFSSKKRVAAIGVVTAATLVGGGMAYAYWTTTGTGTGEATVGTSQAITITGNVAALDTLAPGGPGRAVVFSATNPADFYQTLSTISLVAITPDAAHSTCPTTVGDATAAYTMNDVSVDPVEGNLAPGTTALTAEGQLFMNNLPTTNQNACKGATLTLSFATS